MRSLLLSLVLIGCTPSTPEPVPGQPTAEQRAKAAKVKQMRMAKAKLMKAKLMKAKAAKARATAGGGAQAPGGRVGAAGPIAGQLSLTAQGEGEAMKTRAQLRMAWEGGRHTAFLGVTAGSCEEVEAKEVASGLEATWWASCQWKEMTADFAIVVSGGMILVQRAITKDGEQGEWVTVRRVPLAEGAELTPGEVPEATEPGTADTPEAAAPAPAPQAAPVAPAPAAPAPAAPAPSPAAPAPAAEGGE